MSRVIAYDAALPQTTDILNTNKFAMIAQAFLNQAAIGTAIAVNGLACTPSTPTPNLSVNIANGSIYSIQPADSTAYGDLGTDTQNIVKQGILYAPTTLGPITPPSTSGFSQNFLVQVIYNSVDAGAEVIPYYNSGNPAQPFSGPNNNGMSQFTTRLDLCAVALKAGVAAATGSQVTPAPDAGYTGLFVITVANGQTQITSGNIAQLATAPFFPTLPAIPADVQDGAWVYCADAGVTASQGTQATNATTASGNATLHFASTPGYVAVGMLVNDVTTPGAIPANTTVVSFTGTTVVLSNNAAGGGVGNGDVINFANYTAMVGSVVPAPAALVAGLSVKLKASNTITGASTFNLNGLGAQAVHRANGAATVAGDIAANQVVNLNFDGSAWQIENFQGTGGTGTTNNFTFSIPYAVDTGTVNSVVAPFSPAIVSVAAGNLFEVKIANTNTGPATLTVNALAAVAIHTRAGVPLSAGMLLAGELALFAYDGTYYQLLSDVTDVSGVVGLSNGLSGSSPGGTKTATWSAQELVLGTATGGANLKLSAPSFSFNGAGTGGNGMDTGATPVSSDLSIYAIFNPTTNAVACLGTIACNGPAYTGANMPAGYTFSALIWNGKTDASGNVVRFVQLERTVMIGNVVGFSVGSAVTSFTAASIAGTVPALAKRVGGYTFQGSSANNPAFWLAATADGLGLVFTGYGQTPFETPYFMSLYTPQTVYYMTQSAAPGGPYYMFTTYYQF